MARFRTSFEVIVALVISATAACTGFAAGDDLLRVDDREASSLLGGSEGASIDGDPWWCLDSAESLGVDANENRTQSSVVTLRIPVHDALTQQPPLGVEARVCNLPDLECGSPVHDWEPVPGDGVIVRLVDWGFEGYVELRGEGYPTTMHAVDTPVVRDLSLYSHGMMPVAALNAFARALMRDVLSPEAGLALISATDCNGSYTEGVQVRIDKEGYSYSIANNLPVPGESDTGPQGTIGIGGIAPGVVSIEGYTPDGRLIDRQAIPIRSRTYHGLYLRPIVYSAEELCGADGSRATPGLTRGLVRLRPCAGLAP